tara:strand:- start:957 stop:1262 length:306 start_codon:yes stop_codon:yes gene_type:complete
MKISACKPLMMYLIYFLISCIISLVGLKLLGVTGPIYTIRNTLPSIVITALYSLFLYFLCSKGYMRAAWVVGSIPVIMGAGTILFSFIFAGSAAILMQNAK